jgi:hypothetical protein
MGTPCHAPASGPGVADVCRLRRCNAGMNLQFSIHSTKLQVPNVASFLVWSSHLGRTVSYH